MAELVTSISIMVIITTIVVLNQNNLGTSATLKNISNNLSLSLRQAQVYGISVKEFSPSSYQAYTINSFNAGYGVSFNISAPPMGDSGSYIFFTDKWVGSTKPNGKYDSGISCPLNSECLDKTTLNPGYTVSSLCTIRSGTLDCLNTSLDITFIRPAVEAKIIFNQDISGSAGLSVACIELKSPDNKQNAVVLYTTGQVSVRTMPCSTAI